MFGYDWPRLHAAMNDLPAALLMLSVIFDLFGTINKRESLRAAGYWTLLTGVVGGGAAMVTGNLAEGVIEHSNQAHAMMTTHETLGSIVVVMFMMLALWRVIRRGMLGPTENTIALTAGVIGIALMVYTAKLGGNLVFDHGVGITAARMDSITSERINDHVHAPGEEHDEAPTAIPIPGDSAAAAAPDTAKGTTHTHRDGKTHTHPADTSKRP